MAAMTALSWVPQSRQERPGPVCRGEGDQGADESRQAEIDESQNPRRRESGLARYRYEENGPRSEGRFF